MVQIIARMLGWAPPAAGDRGPAPPPGIPLLPAAEAGFPAPVFDVAALRERNRARAVATGSGSWSGSLPGQTGLPNVRR